MHNFVWPLHWSDFIQDNGQEYRFFSSLFYIVAHYRVWEWSMIGANAHDTIYSKRTFNISFSPLDVHFNGYSTEMYTKTRTDFGQIWHSSHTNTQFQRGQTIVLIQFTTIQFVCANCVCDLKKKIKYERNEYEIQLCHHIVYHCLWFYLNVCIFTM